MALIVNGGLQALGIKAPPPPLVKSTILGEFPLDEHTMPSILEEDEEGADGKDQDHESKEDTNENASDDEVDLTDIAAKDVGDAWYGVIDGPFEEAPDVPATDLDESTNATNRNESNAVYLLTLMVCVLSLSV